MKFVLSSRIRKILILELWLIRSVERTIRQSSAGCPSVRLCTRLYHPSCVCLFVIGAIMYCIHRRRRCCYYYCTCTLSAAAAAYVSLLYRSVVVRTLGVWASAFYQFVKSGEVRSASSVQLGHFPSTLHLYASWFAAVLGRILDPVRGVDLSPRLGGHGGQSPPTTVLLSFTFILSHLTINPPPGTV